MVSNLDGATFERTTSEGFPVLRVSGRIRIGDIAIMERELVSLAQSGEIHVLLDLTRCPYIPSMALPPILGSHQTLAGRGGRLLIAVSKELGEIFRLLKLQGRLNLHASWDECLGVARVLGS